MGSLVKNNMFKRNREIWNYLNLVFYKYNIPIEIIDIIKKYYLTNGTNWKYETKKFGERYENYIQSLETLNRDIIFINYNLSKSLITEKDAYENYELRKEENKKDISSLVEDSKYFYNCLDLEIRTMINDEEMDAYNDETYGGFCHCCCEDIELKVYDEDEEKYNSLEDVVYKMTCREKNCNQFYLENEENEEEYRCKECWDKYFFKEGEMFNPNFKRWNICLDCSGCYRNNNGNVVVLSDEETEEESEEESE